VLTLAKWALKWGVPEDALRDLRATFGAESVEPPREDWGVDEAAVQARVRLQCSRKGALVWRNNVGACVDENGNFIRYGLANDSARVNKKLKSSDLIGVRVVAITPEMVGTNIGQFVALEVKSAGWDYTGSEHEQAQSNFLTLVNGLGGYARFVTHEGQVDV
jgi:hypothetical protein